MDIHELYKTFQTAASGGSGTGASFYSVAATCGRKANLIAAQKLAAEDSVEEDGDALSIGIAYHLCHQLLATKTIAEDLVLDMRDEMVNQNFVEGLRLFQGWKFLWGTLEEKYGEVIGSEIPIEAAVDDFGAPYTGRLDAVVRIENVEMVNTKTGLHLTQPGTYIVDFKTAKGKSAQHAWQFTQGIQGRGYLAMYPEAKGIIFDVLHKVKVFRHTPQLSKDGKIIANISHSHYFQERQLDDKDVIKALVKLGQRNIQNDSCNPAACLSGWQPCPFFKKGICSGY